MVPMRTALLSAALALGLAAAASGQRAAPPALRLDPAPPGPSLGEESAALRTASLLRVEIADLERSAPPDDAERTVRDARAALRRVAFDLLVRGADGGIATADVLAMQGFRIADLRRRIDLVLLGLADGSLRVGDPPRPLGTLDRDRALRLVRRFADGAAGALGNADLSRLEQTDAAIAAAMAPIVDVLAIAERRPGGDALGSGWPTGADLRGGAQSSAAVPAAEGGSALCEAAALAALPQATRAAAEAACAAGRVEDPLVAAAIRCAARLEQATWLSPAERDRIDGALAAALADEALLRVAAARAAILSSGLELLGLRSAAPFDERALRAAVTAALLPDPDAPFADRPDRLARQLARIGESLELSLRFRREPPPVDERDLPRDLRGFRRDFERAYLRAEETSFRELPRLVAERDALSDPALLGLVRGQRLALEDLERLAAVRDVLDRIGGIRPQAVIGVAARLRTILRWLLEPTRRAEGLDAWLALEGQLRLFVPLPYEAALREETPLAIRLAAGRPRELVERIDLLRAEWADGWAQGIGDGPAARGLHRLWRLLRVMATLDPTVEGSSTEAADGRGTALLLSRWGAFYVPPAAFAPALLDLDALTRLAVTSALAGDDATLERELARLERDLPLARLAGRLFTELEPWIARRPGGPLGLAVPLRTAPDEDAWGLDLRLRLAAVARYARELEHARRNDRRELERPILEHLARLSESILDSLGAERSPVVALPELRESLPVPGGRRATPRAR